MNFKLLLISALFLAACAQGPVTSNPTPTPGTNAKHSFDAKYKEQLFAHYAPQMEAEWNALRKPANDSSLQEQLKLSLSDLNKINPKKFEIYVFPKKSTITMKTSEPGEITLGKPTVIEVSTLANTSCQFLIKSGFKKYNPKAYFPAELGEKKSRNCAIIEMTSRTLLTMNRSLLKNGDEVSKRLYMDDAFNVYGIETDYYLSENGVLNLKSIGFKYEAGTPVSAGLGIFPTDMPSLSRVTSSDRVATNKIFRVESLKPGQDQNTYANFDTQVDRVSFNQIKRLNQKFKVPNCEMFQMKYQDMYLSSVNMYWCQGKPWPQVVENNQFVAVTQNLQ